MKKYAKLFFMLAVFSFAVFGAAESSYAAKPSDYGLKDGDLISAIFSDDPDVYIVNENGYKRLFLNPEIFNFYGHLGGFFNVKLVSVETRDAFATSGLFRNCESNDPRVFGVEVDGEDMGNARWLDSSADTVLKEDPEFFKKVFCINNKEFKWYPKGLNFKALKDLPKYERLKEKAKISTKEKIEKDLKYYGKDDDDDKDEDKDDYFYEKKIKGIGKVVVCHKSKETLTVGASALKGHLKHGDKLGSCGEQTPPPASEDTTAPAISGISATSTTSVSTHIIWSTNEKSNSKVWYSTSTPVVATSTTISVQSAAFVKSHNVALTGLTASTTYYYLVESSDGNGNVATSSEQSFTTLASHPPAESVQDDKNTFDYTSNHFESSLKIDLYDENSYVVNNRNDVELFKFKLSDAALSPYAGTYYTHADNEEIQIRRIKFTKLGEINDADISNIRLINLDTGYVLQAVQSVSNGIIEFNLDANSSKPDWGVMVSWHSYGLVAKVNSSAKGDVRLTINGASDIGAFDFRNDSRVAKVTKLNTFPLNGSVINLLSQIAPSSKSVILWDNITPKSDKTEGNVLHIGGYSTAKLIFNWSGDNQTHTCQYAYSEYSDPLKVDYYSTFLYFSNSGCNDAAVILIRSDYIKIDAWTSPFGILNGSLLLE